MTRLEMALYDVRNGVTGARFTTRAMREARKFKLVEFSRKHGEIKLTREGWRRLHDLEAKYGPKGESTHT
jgi:hypothetical protein